MHLLYGCILAALIHNLQTWQVGDQFKYSIPKDGKHWETLLEPMMERDRTQCAAWKEEIQNLVIFVSQLVCCTTRALRMTV